MTLDEMLSAIDKKLPPAPPDAIAAFEQLIGATAYQHGVDAPAKLGHAGRLRESCSHGIRSRANAELKSSPRGVREASCDAPVTAGGRSGDALKRNMQAETDFSSNSSSSSQSCLIPFQ